MVDLSDYSAVLQSKLEGMLAGCGICDPLQTLEAFEQVELQIITAEVQQFFHELRKRRDELKRCELEGQVSAAWEIAYRLGPDLAFDWLQSSPRDLFGYGDLPIEIIFQIGIQAVTRKGLKDLAKFWSLQC